MLSSSNVCVCECVCVGVCVCACVCVGGGRGGVATTELHPRTYIQYAQPEMCVGWLGQGRTHCHRKSIGSEPTLSVLLTGALEWETQSYFIITPFHLHALIHRASIYDQYILSHNRMSFAKCLASSSFIHWVRIQSSLEQHFLFYLQSNLTLLLNLLPYLLHSPHPIRMYHQKYFLCETKVRANSVCRYMPSTNSQK